MQIKTCETADMVTDEDVHRGRLVKMSMEIATQYHWW